MAFWRIGSGVSSASAIDRILDRPDHGLTELLDEPDLLPEVLAPNGKLVEYLIEPETLTEMVHMITTLYKEHQLEQDTEPETEGEGDTETETKTEMETKTEAETETKTEAESRPHNTETDASAVVEPCESENASRDSFMDTDSESDEDAEKSYDEDDDDDDDEDDDEEERKRDEEFETREKYAHICAEILSADVWSLSSALMERVDLIEELWAVLDFPTPLDIAHASYFTRISEHLLEKKTDELLEFIRDQQTFVDRMLRHIDNPPLMDFLLKVISTDKRENSTGVIDLLQVQGFVPKLISFLAPDVSSSVQAAAGDFLKAFVTISASSNNDNGTIGPNELSRELVSEPCIKELIRLMLCGGTGLATGVGVVIEIIRKNNSDYDNVAIRDTTLESHPPGPRDPIYLGTMVQHFAQAIPQFQAMLTKTHQDRLDTPFGAIEPLGFERFKICELFAELLHCSNMGLLNDPVGEKIVKARNAERERLKRVIAEATNHLDSEQSSLNLPSEESAVKGLDNQFRELDIKEGDAIVRSDSDEEEEEEEEEERGEGDVSEDKDQEFGESYEENQAPPTLEEYEQHIRAEPTVGDELKIALHDNGCITAILKMFFQFPWNNFLHNVVFDIVQQVFGGSMTEGYNKFLAISLFDEGRITEVICEGYDECEEYERVHKTRLGYMGHLTLISEEVVKFTALIAPTDVSPIVSVAISKPSWINYVTNTLVRTREQYNAILGGERPVEEIQGNPNAIILGNGEEVNTDDYDEPDPITYGTTDYVSQEASSNMHEMDDEGEEYEDEEDEQYEFPARQDYNAGDGRNDGDSDGSKFAQYLAHQMSGTGTLGSSDEDEDEDDWSGNRTEAGGIVSYGKSKEDDEVRSYPIAEIKKLEDGEDDEDLSLVRSQSHSDDD